MGPDIQNFRPGVLSKRQIRTLAEQGYINSTQEPVGISSVDLHLGSAYWVMEGGIKGRNGIPYSEVLKDTSFHKEKREIKPGDYLELQKQCTYVIQLQEGVRFEKDSRIRAYATGKSSIGRLDVLTRLIVDNGDAYDTVPEDSRGSLYLEVTPITFPIRVGIGLTLSQIRFFRGKPALSRISREEYNLYPAMLVNQDPESVQQDDDDQYLHLDLTESEFGGVPTSAFRGKKQVESPIDLTVDSKLDPRNYWDQIQSPGGALEVQPESFYILRSRERFKLPEDVAVYAHAMAENLGEIRIHYAGFVHPGFGLYREDGKGTPLIFEVRGHNVKTFLRHGEKLARISFYKMSEPWKLTEDDKREEREQGYENQELKLSKHFAPWD